MPIFSDRKSQPGLTIRLATRRDLEAIGDLWIELMSFHAELDDRFRIPPQGRAHYMRHIHNALHDTNFRVLVAEEYGQVLGYILGYVAQNPPIFPQSRYGFIADLCVSGLQRRRGIGELLVKAMTEWFRVHGLHNIQLNVAHHNPVSQAFWRKIGCLDYIDHLWLKLDAE